MQTSLCSKLATHFSEMIDRCTCNFWIISPMGSSPITTMNERWMLLILTAMNFSCPLIFIAMRQLAGKQKSISLSFGSYLKWRMISFTNMVHFCRNRQRILWENLFKIVGSSPLLRKPKQSTTKFKDSTWNEWNVRNRLSNLY